MAKPKMDFSTFKRNTNISGSYNVINDNEKKERVEEIIRLKAKPLNRI